MSYSARPAALEREGEGDGSTRHGGHNSSHHYHHHHHHHHHDKHFHNRKYHLDNRMREALTSVCTTLKLSLAQSTNLASVLHMATHVLGSHFSKGPYEVRIQKEREKRMKEGEEKARSAVFDSGKAAGIQVRRHIYIRIYTYIHIHIAPITHKHTPHILHLHVHALTLTHTLTYTDTCIHQFHTLQSRIVNR